MSSVPPPRIYNLFPLLAGNIERWREHLPRIAGMAFDWVFVNPFFEPGASGSLYAIRNPSRPHPVVAGAADFEQSIKAFTARAHRHGLRVMADLVINHTAQDALLAGKHPDWYLRDEDGALRAPYAVDPIDPRKATVWSDLAELDYETPENRRALVAHFAQAIARLLELGFAGFRCDAAYKVPADVWRELIGRARRRQPDAVFAAETLGCTPEQAEALAEAGFDLMFNSAKWWDFHSDWLFEQRERFRRLAPSIAFPESHDTERLAAELGAADLELRERHYRLRYLFAAFFSHGVMIPMGFEYGFATRLHVVETRPADWDRELAEPHIDLTAFIAEVNRLKAAHPSLVREAALERITAPHARAVGLMRLDAEYVPLAGEAAFLLLNPDERNEAEFDGGSLWSATGGRFQRLLETTPGAAGVDLEAGALTLAPLEARLLLAREPTEVSGRAPAPRDSERRLKALAANRIAIEQVRPEIDGGRHAVKRTVGDILEVSADVFCDGHERIDACVRYRASGGRWQETPMRPGENDRWTASVPLTRNTRYEYGIEAWRDLFATWREELTKKLGAGQDVALEIDEGAALVRRTAQAARASARRELDVHLNRIGDAAAPEERLEMLLSNGLATLMRRHAMRINASRYDRVLEVIVDRPAARFAAWYEMFPRSQSGDADRHGSFDDVIERLPYVREMGFDVLYFPPIHPIGTSDRKGRNNALRAAAGDPGSPYAIGSEDGGHTAIHAELGTHADFARLVEAARAHGLEIALDFAIQCSPDHPWIAEHPEWFEWRPDRTIKHAENPPKKYEDIVNVHFYREAFPAIWYELRDVVLFWAAHGVKAFRVDNPHTKPLPFWEWMIREVQDRHPDAIFLSEAFTRPKMMKRLAKIGFTQSYTYFTWRNTKQELIDYMTELTRSEAREFFRPNFFTNTPDINPPLLQTGGRPAFMTRFLLAATLSDAYGIYNGFELCEGTPVPGREEYLDSEKYEIRAWDWDRPGHIREFISRVNRIRRENPALHDHLNVEFYNAWNENVLLYGKMTPRRDNVILIAVNLDPHTTQDAHFEVPLWRLGLPDHAGVGVEDLLSRTSFRWTGKIQHVRLDPAHNPCAVWRIVPS
ncbi:MAG TPA: maltotransferase domain-containing protein [Gammaproteobacteria bacterium]|nr:maltotransferase domain-containing protein [Gammaproteobacteria bacterium]